MSQDRDKLINSGTANLIEIFQKAAHTFAIIVRAPEDGWENPLNRIISCPEYAKRKPGGAR